ncbi:ABC transporter ATP-binding protein [Pectinatus haikarae]|uniref:Energy-coupling factor transport system ATP-binding protein n=1 Tax=Pectinatus haikarae TaxID=349096 RepID=A0ABT9Y513_9FIRM|nr:ABC transporter ATP-binding protein [Pectinatus haikarae]MDQ0202924.1 energy-coupling factor transport system ATP-binding protein [Pectinatus haikarae]
MTKNKRYNKSDLRWITITTLLLAIGVILRIISPNVGGISLNWNIVMYATAILLCRPSLRQGFGIGMVSGIIATMTSKAALPYANLISDPVAALVCALLAGSHILDFKLGRLRLEPVIIIFITTFISGGIFVTLTKIVLSLPMSLYLYAMLPAVLLVAALGSIAGQLLYLPAAKIFNDDNIADRAPFILHDIDLTIPKNSFFVITGVNGSGKTTLLLSMAGVRPSYFGGFENSSINIDGFDIINDDPALLNRKFGVVMADYEAQLVTETVNDEIAFSLENIGMDPLDIIKKRDDVLKKTGLEKMGSRKISSLSGGQKQRLVIAAVLAMDTPVLVLDEPVAAVDPEGAKEIYELLYRLNKDDGKTIIVAEHDLKYVLDMQAQMAVIDKSYLKISGEKDKCFKYMYENKVYPEVIPLRWKIRWEMGQGIC